MSSSDCGTPLSSRRVCALMREVYVPGMQSRVRALALRSRVRLTGMGREEGDQDQAHPLMTIWLTLGEMQAYLNREKRGKG